MRPPKAQALLAACAAVALFFANPAHGVNEIRNGGFEERVADTPAQWKLFVAPGDGATGEISTDARTGQYSVMLHTPTPYAKEPVNNWSQNIVAELAGKTVGVTGWIKTEGAQEAALWLQCWRRQPWGVIKTFTTSTDAPMYDARPWEEVTFKAEIPAGTDFLVLRCVLLGTGTAWFDDIEVTVEKPPEKEAPAAPPEPAPALEPVKESAPPGADPAALLKHLEAEIGRMREANLIMAEALQQVRVDNSTLLQELLQLRQALEAVQAEAAVLELPAWDDLGATPVPRVPPLVPHGFDWRILE